MTRGTKSLLFGVHQFVWHPLTVFMAWRVIYGRWPTWRESLCIFIHDWGYWGCETMDGEDGERHPELGANLAYMLLGSRSSDLVLLHSRHYARHRRMYPSMLCWADKACVMFYPRWLYLTMARMSGELAEYRMESAKLIPNDFTDEEWFEWFREYSLELVYMADIRGDLGWRAIDDDN